MKLHPKLKSVGQEFKEFILTAFEKNWKLASVVLLFIVCASFDEIRMALRGHGMFILLVRFIGEVWNILKSFF